MNNDLVPDAENSVPLGTNPMPLPVTITDGTDDDLNPNLFFDLFVNQIEMSYILNRTTREGVIRTLAKLYDVQSGLDLVETVEEMDKAKEQFYKEITERVRRELRANNEI